MYTSTLYLYPLPSHPSPSLPPSLLPSFLPPSLLPPFLPMLWLAQWVTCIVRHYCHHVWLLSYPIPSPFIEQACPTVRPRLTQVH